MKSKYHRMGIGKGLFDIVIKEARSKGATEIRLNASPYAVLFYLHGISFETAAYVFEDENYIEMYDFEHSIEEDRYIAIGCVGDVLFVVFTERRENIRLISARLATESEGRLYYDQDIRY